MVGHCVKIGKIDPTAERVIAIEDEPAALLIKQAAAERALEQIEPLPHNQQRHFRRAQPLGRPVGFNLANPLDHQFIIGPMRAAMKRQADPQCRRVIGGQKQSIAAKIVETDPLGPDQVQHYPEAAL